MYRHSYSVRLARKLSKMEDVEYPVEMAVVTGELMYRRSLSDKDVFLIDYPEFDNKYSYFYIPPFCRNKEPTFTIYHVVMRAN